MIARVVACVVAVVLGAGQPPAPVVRQIDHILFATGPEGAGLVSILRDQFQLPVVFDGLSQTPRSGGVCFGFGNACLEVIPRPADPARPSGEARITSLALQAGHFATTPEELRARGIDHFPPSEGARWTTIGLRGLGHGAFFIDYRHDMDAHREEFRKKLAERDGGPLGITSIREVAISPAELQDTGAGWQRLLGEPAIPGVRFWKVGDGPGIRLVADDDPLRHRIVVTVKDRSRAAAVLTRFRIPFEATEAAIYIDRAAMSGLRLVLTQ